MNTRDGFFDARSVTRRISRESLGLLGGGRAVLLQLAHPLVAAGVADHSNFHADPLARLERTADLMLTIVFGERRRAQDALRQFHVTHARIHGYVPRTAGRYPSDSAYSANDPSLKAWVLATLIDTSLITYERFVSPLTRTERDEFYTESLTLARLMGIPDGVLPNTLDGFNQFMSRAFSGDTLFVTDVARQLASQVLDPAARIGVVPRACARLLRFVTAGLLPARVRAEFGLTWNAPQQRALDMLSTTTRALRPMTPAFFSLMPQAGGGQFVRWALWANRRKAA
ncbi:MAG: oxygenase MpaB family protein [Chloroflexota bacterium]